MLLRIKRLVLEAHRRSLWQVLGIYLASAWIGYQVILALTQGVGLPHWVPAFAATIFVIGLPIVLATAFVQEGGPMRTGPAATEKRAEPASAESAGAPPPPFQATPAPPAAGRLARLLTWNRALLGGVLAFALLGLATSGYMAMRLAGVGPVASLVAAGVLDERERVLVAEFTSAAGDSVLAGAVTEAFRVDLLQSPLVTMVEPAYVATVLRRMGREPATRLDAELAREVALREGIKAVLTGEIRPAGRGFVISASLLAADPGRTLVAYRETAADSAQLLRAVDRLSRRLRGKIGESLKSVRAGPPLEQVTTSSLEALRKYSQAIRAMEVERDEDKAIALLKEAVARDSAFAMAWRKLGVAHSRQYRPGAEMVHALTRAYEHRDRLSDRERYLTLGTYYQGVTYESDQAITAYRTLLDSYPHDREALSNLAGLYARMKDRARAEELYRRALELDSLTATLYQWLIIQQIGQGKSDEARATLAAYARKFPGNPGVREYAASLALALGQYDSAAAYMRALRDEQRGSSYWTAYTSWVLGDLAALHGRAAEARRHYQDVLSTSRAGGFPDWYVWMAVESALLHALVGGDPLDAASGLDDALAAWPLDSIAPLDRQYPRLAEAYALAGRPSRARSLLTEWEKAVEPMLRRRDQPDRHRVLGAIALAEGRPDDAAREYSVAETMLSCVTCVFPEIGRAHEAAGRPDSAIVAYERYLGTPWFYASSESRPFARPLVYERLGKLYEQRGQPEQAALHYAKFVELWQDADAELLPRVREAQRRLERLVREQPVPRDHGRK